MDTSDYKKEKCYETPIVNNMNVIYPYYKKVRGYCVYAYVDGYFIRGTEKRFEVPVVYDASFVDLGLPSGTLWSIKALESPGIGRPGTYTGTPYIDSYSYPNLQLPSKKQAEELLYKCKRIDFEYDGYSCLLFIGPNGNALVVSKSGYRYKGNINKYKEYAYFWTSTTTSGGDRYAFITNDRISSHSSSFEFQIYPVYVP